MADAHPKAGASHKRVGSLVRGKYRVEAFLATGTMANVYAATHRNGARVALKILHPQLAEDPSLCERFKREGYFANSIGHPGIVRAIDDDVTEDGCPFMVMELLDGETLDERRRRKGGKLPLAWVLPVADALLDILAAAHAREVVHRDLKPDNVFVTKNGEVKVLDFGVARWNDGKSSSDMTAVGMVLGTPAYMPPEQALGRREDVDAQSDLWAVGATLFVVLSGESVHVGGDAKAKLIATARTAARPLREAAPEVPRAVAAVIDRALAFHKQERWPDAAAMREALRWARMSVEDRPSQVLAATSETALQVIPAPVPTRRTMEEEVTIARAVVREELPPSMPPQSKDFLTSAPPITLRDVPRSTAADPGSLGPGSSSNGDPVFSLRREKEEPPSTVRIPQGDAGLSDPFDRSIEVNLSLTLPMAAVVMPEPEAPRPAAGMPAAASPRPGYPSPAASAPPPPMMMQASAPPPPFQHHSSAPPAFSQLQTALQTAPSLRAQAAQRRSLPPDAPGPMLSQVVKPRAGLMRILVPLTIGLVAALAAFVVLRSRAATAARAGLSPAASASVASSVQNAGNAPGGEASPTNAGNPGNAGPATVNVASLPSMDPKAAGTAALTPSPAAADAPVKKARPPRKAPRKPPPKPAEPVADPPPSAGASTAADPTPAPAPSPAPSPTPAPTAAPVDPTPRDSLPAKDPEPKPAPTPTPTESPAN